MVPLSRPAAWGLSGKRRGATQSTSETTRAMLDARCNGACLLDARADELAISSGVGRPGGIIKRAAVDIKIRASATGIAPHSQRCVWHRRVWYRPAPIFGHLRHRSCFIGQGACLCRTDHDLAGYDLTLLYLIMQIVATSSICFSANARVPCRETTCHSECMTVRRMTGTHACSQHGITCLIRASESLPSRHQPPASRLCVEKNRRDTLVQIFACVRGRNAEAHARLAQSAAEAS